MSPRSADNGATTAWEATLWVPTEVNDAAAHPRVVVHFTNATSSGGSSEEGDLRLLVKLPPPLWAVPLSHLRAIVYVITAPVLAQIALVHTIHTACDLVSSSFAFCRCASPRERFLCTLSYFCGVVCDHLPTVARLTSFAQLYATYELFTQHCIIPPCQLVHTHHSTSQTSQLFATFDLAMCTTLTAGTHRTRLILAWQLWQRTGTNRGPLCSSWPTHPCTAL
jgi:hypothetical protein